MEQSNYCHTICCVPRQFGLRLEYVKLVEHGDTYAVTQMAMNRRAVHLTHLCRINMALGHGIVWRNQDAQGPKHTRDSQAYQVSTEGIYFH